MYLKTPQVATQLGITYSTLMEMMRARKFPPPRKDYSGDFIWTPEDVARVAAARKLMFSRRQRAAQGGA
jgi:predicted DNA-binding transcriptional regulator AlpA